MTSVSYPAMPGNKQVDDTYPAFGVFPRTRLGRVFMGWAALNVVLALLPVFDLAGNSAAIGPMGMPVTVFYSYAVFSLNCVLGGVYYATRGRAWVDIAEKGERGDAQ